jgi:pyridoxine 5-phosphate synthase
MAALGVNIDHVATIRQARRTVEPDPVWAATEAELAGASCITFHLRKDRRHVNDRDAALLGQTVLCKLNMEMSMDPEIVEIALDLKPDQVTLVPESRQEVTTEGGLDAAAELARLTDVTASMKAAGVLVSAFVDAEDDQIEAAQQAGCDAIEIHTGSYANAFLLGGREGERRSGEELQKLARGVEKGRSLGLVVHGGHGLTYNNVQPVAAIDGFTEFNIGHSIVARAVLVGMQRAVGEMKALLGGRAV